MKWVLVKVQSHISCIFSTTYTYYHGRRMVKTNRSCNRGSYLKKKQCIIFSTFVWKTYLFLGSLFEITPNNIKKLITKGENAIRKVLMACQYHCHRSFDMQNTHITIHVTSAQYYTVDVPYSTNTINKKYRTLYLVWEH